MSNVEKWWRDENGRNPSSEIHRDILASTYCQELDEVLPACIMETRKENSEQILRIQFASFSLDCIAVFRYFTQTRIYLRFVLP